MKAFPSKQDGSRKFLGVQGGVPLFEDGQDACHAGMDLRDYFAAKAIPIYLEWFVRNEGVSQLETCEQAADWSYAMADAMMRAREE